ncbi:RDD family protein [Neobacillus sp. CF12]|uniref:RDD family protein n=1 Tax=Neobacillus sp. CF12 TaxID=3055864 RepID=UPI0025A29C7A|nr:RDD family protein [Neobacillus sp. CF12]MDM5329966.1 RDD family protein [Neobacillus sp. CF12]
MINKIILASRKSRVLAYMIDYAVLGVVSVPLMMLMIMAEENEANAPIFLLFLVLFLLYALKDAAKGQSVGKRLLGIGVRKQENYAEIPSISKLVFRNLTQILGFIEFIVLAVNKDKQRLGDKLAKTVVVKLE